MASAPDHAESTFQVKWAQAGDFIWKYFPAALSVIAWIGALFAQKLFWPLVWMVPQHLWLATGLKNIAGLVLTIAAFFSFLLSNSASEKGASLRDENQRLRKAVGSIGADYFSIWHHILATWAVTLGLSGDERISLYKYSAGKFLMIGRFSLNPLFNETGRGVYPIDEGCIGAAWKSRDGRCFGNAFPDSAADEDAYLKAHQNDWGLVPDVAKALGMKSRAIYALAIKDSTQTRRQAIVVYESMDLNGLDCSKIDAFQREVADNQIALFMDALKNQEPSLELATQEGF